MYFYADGAARVPYAEQGAKVPVLDTVVDRTETGFEALVREALALWVLMSRRCELSVPLLISLSGNR